MSEPAGLSLSLDALIAKHGGGAPAGAGRGPFTQRGGGAAGGRGAPARGGSVGGVRGGGISKVRSPGRGNFQQQQQQMQQGPSLAYNGGRGGAGTPGFDHRVYRGGGRGGGTFAGGRGNFQAQQQQQQLVYQQRVQQQPAPPQQQRQQPQQQQAVRQNVGTYAAGGGYGRVAPPVAPHVFKDAASGNVVAELEGVRLVAISATGEVQLSTGGYWEQSVIDAMNDTVNMIGISVEAEGGDPAAKTWKVHDGRAMMRFVDGMRLPSKGLKTATRARSVLIAFDPAAATAGANAALTATRASNAAALAAGILPQAYGGGGGGRGGAAGARPQQQQQQQQAYGRGDEDAMVVDEEDGYGAQQQQQGGGRGGYVQRGGRGRPESEADRRLKAQGRFVQERF